MILTHHRRETGPVWRPLGWAEGARFATATAILAIASAALWTRGAESVDALTAGLDPLHVTETKYIVAGAGQGAPGTLHYAFSLNWTKRGEER